MTLHIQLVTLSLLPECFAIFKELRPHLSSVEAFMHQVQRQESEGYQIAAIFHEGQAVACIGYREMTTLAWGKIIYVDDLITAEKARGKGYGKALLEFAIDEARKKGCAQIHLDTGYHRHAAHRLYLKMGFELSCHHMSLNLKEGV